MAAAILFGCLGCSARGAQNFVRAIPGTEQVAVKQFSISVSPDERWLAFTEWVLPKSRVFEDLPRYEYEVRIATLNLETNRLIRHGIGSIPASALGFAPGDSFWKGQAGLEIIEQRFRPPGWRESVFYFQPYSHGTHVALDARTPGMQVTAAPAVPLTCSDCPSTTSVQFRDRSWDLLSDDVSVVVNEGMVEAVYYVASPFQPQDDHRTVYRVTQDTGEVVVVEVPDRRGVVVVINAVRVSPRGRYLAYVRHSKVRHLFGGVRQELLIRDLSTQRELEVATYGFMSNLIWSPNSERLYFAGGEYETDSAVRVVDVAAAFAP